MEIYNADGGQVEMCGNGIRCFAKYVYDHGITRKRELEVETLAGIIRPKIVGTQVEVDMGEPILEGRKIPVDADGEIKNRPLAVDGETYEVTCVSMGNPHCVLYLEDIDSVDLAKTGPSFEHHPFFPKRVNTEFIKILASNEVNMRVWERGAGRDLGLWYRRLRGGCCRRHHRTNRARAYGSSQRRGLVDRVARQ